MVISEAEFIKVEQVITELKAQRELNAQYREQIKQAEIVIALDKRIQNLTDQEREARKAEIAELRQALKKGEEIEKRLQEEVSKLRKQLFVEKVKFWTLLGGAILTVGAILVLKD